MGLLDKKKNEVLTPDMAGYRPKKEWWPDLTDYRKAMLLHGVSPDDVRLLLEEYATLCTDKKKVVCDFFYAPLPDDPSWVYLEFPNFEGVSHHRNFWHYQNLMVWLGQKSDREFCLAIPRNQAMPLMLAMRDTQNPCGDSCVGIYADRDFYFELSGDFLEWGPVPTSEFNYVGCLQGVFGFDTQWIPNTIHCEWERCHLALMCEE